MSNSKRKCRFCQERKRVEEMVIINNAAFCNMEEAIKYALSLLELAWTSFPDRHVEYLDLPYFGATGRDISRDHPNQKPIKLYQNLLDLYAKEGQRILDTHLGSGSSAIAAHYGGFEFVGCEIDKHYYDAAVKRFDAETAQQALAL